MEKVEVIFFDLFFTLVEPQYLDGKNEYDVLNLTQSEWEKYSEDWQLYDERAKGEEKNPVKIIEQIVKKAKFEATDLETKEILKLRKKRFKKALKNVEPHIIKALEEIKQSGKKICLISNADIIDTEYWSESPLYDLFDAAIFSHEVGYLKPQFEIYSYALQKMKITPDKCLFVGDGGSNEFEGARKVGIKTVFFNYFLNLEGKKLEEMIKNTDYFFDDLEKLLHY